MRVQFRPTPFPHAVVSNLLPQQVVTNIKKELRGLWDANIPHGETESAYDDNGDSLKSGSGVFLDGLYSIRSNSFTLRELDAVIAGTMWDKIANQGDVLLHRTARMCDQHHSLANFYLPREQYKAHSDHAHLTAIYTLFAYEKVRGGGLCFPDADVKLKAEDNCLVVFPSGVRHQALPVIGGVGDDGPARYSIAMFLTITPPQATTTKTTASKPEC